MNKLLFTFSLLLALTAVGCGETETEKAVSSGNAAVKRINREAPELQAFSKTPEAVTARDKEPSQATDLEVTQSIEACKKLVKMTTSINEQSKILIAAIDRKDVKYKGTRSDVITTRDLSEGLKNLYSARLKLWEAEKLKRAAVTTVTSK